MELIKWKLDKITEAWNYYFWEYKLLQDRINFNSEVKTNYYGEILSYFNDTFDLLYINPTNTFPANIFHYNGLLQIMYVHQDLMDELLYIFKLPSSPLSAKAPIREIRNELIGHPIRRNKNGNDLVSTVLFSNYTSNTKLQYLKYAQKDNFKMQIINYDTQVLIEQHKQYLHIYFDVILKKICNILTKYSKSLEELNNNLLKNIGFKKIVNQTGISYESIFKVKYLYKKEYLLECFTRQNDHKRYENAVKIFMIELKYSLEESQQNITNFTEEVKRNSPPVYSGITVKPLLDSIEINLPSKYKKDYIYELGKLHEKHPVFSIAYFKQEFIGNNEIISELENMEMYFYNDLEYYSSYEYLRVLILGPTYTSNHYSS